MVNKLSEMKAQVGKVGEGNCDRAWIDSFLEQFFVRDNDGQICVVRCANDELTSLLNGQTHSPALNALGDIIDLETAKSCKSEVLARFKELASGYKWSVETRKQRNLRCQALSPIDQLKELALTPDNPSVAVVVAKMYLYGWFDTPRDPEYAVSLLEKAARYGLPDAHYLLATGKIVNQDVGPFNEKTLRAEREAAFLIESKLERKRHEDIGLDTSPVIAYRAKQQSEMSDDALAVELAMDGDDAREMIDIYERDIAECPDASHYQHYCAAEKKLDLLFLEEFQESRPDSDYARRLRSEIEAHLNVAKDRMAEARTLLAEHFAKTDEEAFALLRSAAAPENGVSRDWFAAATICVRFVGNSKSRYFDLEAATNLLRLLFLHPCAPYGAGKLKETSKLSEAAIVLADLTLEDAEISQAEKCEIYEVLKGYAPFSSVAALQCGLMALRGNVCRQDMEACKKFLEYALQPSSSEREASATVYAKSLLSAGWHSHVLVREAAFDIARHMEHIGFRTDPLCPVLEADAASLIRLNAHRHSANNAGTGALERFFSSLEDQIASLFYALKSEVVCGDRFEAQIQAGDPLAAYVMGQLWREGRFGNVDLNESKRYLEMASTAAKALFSDKTLMTKRSVRADFLDCINAGLIEVDRRLKEKEVAAAIEHDRRQMISFLSHTLVNVTAGASRMLQEIMSEMTTAKDPAILASLAARLAPTAARASVVESLVKVFKLYTSDDDALRNDWMSEQGGDHMVLQTVILALQMTLLRFCRMPEFKSARRKLLPNVDYDTLTDDFITEIIPLEGNTDTEIAQIVGWINRRLPFLKVSFIEVESTKIVEDGARHIVIFAMIGEFLANGIKFVRAGGKIALTVTRTESGLELTCSNPIDRDSVPQPLSGKSGLSFIKTVCDKVSADFDAPIIDGECFSLRVLLPIK